MNIEKALQQRAQGVCELCQSDSPLKAYIVPPKTDETLDTTFLICQSCQSQIDDPSTLVPEHWHRLTDLIWSPTPAIQVVAYRLLNQIKAENWAMDILETLYLEDDILTWAKDDNSGDNEPSIQHLDSNGVVLNAGDNITLIKDLNVKGAGFTAKRGTAVRGISLVHDNKDQIEGRVNGQRIVILCQYVKKLK